MKVQGTEGGRRSGSAVLFTKWELEMEAANHTLFSLLKRSEQTDAHCVLGMVVHVNAGHGGAGSRHIISMDQ